MRTRTVLARVAVVLLAAVSPFVLSEPALAQLEPCPPGQPTGRVPGTPPGAGAVPTQPEGRPAQYPLGKCQLRLSRSVVAAGESVGVSGAGYAAGAQVRVSAAGVTLATITADASGSFSTDVVIPASVDPGTYQVTAAGAAAGGGTQVLSATLTVTEPAASRSRASLGDALPRTGSNDILPTTAAGFGLVAVGTAAVIAARRRRSSPPAP